LKQGLTKLHQLPEENQSEDEVKRFLHNKHSGIFQNNQKFECEKIKMSKLELQSVQQKAR